MIEVDVETDGVQWYAGVLFLAQFMDEDGNLDVLFHPADDRAPRDDSAKIQAWLDRRDDPEGFRAWNTKFDFHFLEEHGYTLPPEDTWHDGMVAAHVLDERFTVALKARGEKLFGKQVRDHEKAVKDWLNKENARRRKVSKETGEPFVFASYRDVPMEIMDPYAREDVVLTKNIGKQHMPVLNAVPELGDIYDLERKVLPALYNVEKRGLPMDVEATNKFQLELSGTLDEMEENLRELAGIRTFNPNAPRQVEEALRRRGADLSRVSHTEGGKALSMDDENLQTVDDPLADAVRKWRTENKLMTSYINPMLNEHYDSSLHTMKAPFITPDGLIHTNYRQVGARHGRMSSSDPNVQNFPRDDLRLRYLVQAPPGFKIVTADLSSIELVLFAAFVGEGRLMRAVREGGDLHTLTADGIGLEDYVRASGDIEPRRQRGKTFNYSMIYGAGQRSVRKHFYVPQKRAKEMIESYERLYPEVPAFKDRIAIQLSDNGYVRDAMVYKKGRRRQRAGKLGSREAYKYVNYLVSGTAADMLKVATVKLHEQGVPMIFLVHDEIGALVREEEAERTADLIVDALTDHPNITKLVPLSADAAIVDRWSQAKKPDFVPAYAKGM